MPDPKKAPPPSSGDNQALFFLLVAAMIIFIIIPSVIAFFGFSDVREVVDGNFFDQARLIFTSFIETVSFLSIFISFVLILTIVYIKLAHKETVLVYENNLNKIERLIQDSKKPKTRNPVAPISFVPNAEKGNAPEQNAPNPKWQQIEKHMFSQNQSEWRIAILEADILLFDMLSQMGYQGDSIGEILRNVDKASFATLDDAWKAHKIRNIIAHEGANFLLTRDEAERAIRLYKRVFEEFYYI
jgi:hypothetical protein